MHIHRRKLAFQQLERRDLLTADIQIGSFCPADETRTPALEGESSVPQAEQDSIEVALFKSQLSGAFGSDTGRALKVGDTLIAIEGTRLRSFTPSQQLEAGFSKESVLESGGPIREFKAIGHTVVIASTKMNDLQTEASTTIVLARISDGQLVEVDRVIKKSDFNYISTSRGFFSIVWRVDASLEG